MAVQGLCSICGAPGAMHTCALCGRLVCARHFDHASRTCAAHGAPGQDPSPGAPPHGRT